LPRRRRHPGAPPAVEGQHAVADERELGELAGKEQDRPTGVGETAEQRVDLALGADVDPARRVEAEHRLEARGEPARDGDLLLVSSGKPANLACSARVDLQRGDRLPYAASLFTHRDRTPAPHGVVARRSDVLAHRALRQQGMKTVGRNEDDTGTDRVVGVS
jgi:hypothetical protein